MKEPVLLVERLIVGICMSLCCLEGHVGICYLRDHRQPERDSEEEYEDGDRQIYPLHIAKRRLVVKGEEHIGPQDGGDHCADAVEGLRDVDSNFGIFWGTAD